MVYFTTMLTFAKRILQKYLRLRLSSDPFLLNIEDDVIVMKVLRKKYLPNKKTSEINPRFYISILEWWRGFASVVALIRFGPSELF